MVSEHFGTPIGGNKLRQLRSSTLREREAASDPFAEKLAEFLPPAACVGATLAKPPSDARDARRNGGPAVLLYR